MNTKNINKAIRNINNARSNFWEAGYLWGTSYARRSEKRRANRARRQLDKALCTI